MSRITIDPITRIEGHLSVSADVSDNVVTAAYMTGTLFRGIETILKNRLPEDAWLITQRVCGVCTYVHGLASVRAVEQAYGAVIPANARVLRNLLMGSQYIHDHLVHFYHLLLPDFVDFASAATADAAATATLATSVSPGAPYIDFAAAKQKLQTFLGSGQTGIFSGGYWGHPAYILTPEENLLFATHYLHVLREQVKAARMQAVFGGKNPHVQSLRVGGCTCFDELTADNIAIFRSLLVEMDSLVSTLYLPDATYLCTRYKSLSSGGGFGNYLCYGEFPQNADESQRLFPRGIIRNNNPGIIEPVDVAQITENISRSWYSGAGSQLPESGVTNPAYTTIDTTARYSWLKAPRYNNEPLESGPLARMLLSVASGNSAATTLINTFLTKASLGMSDLHSTIGRIICRALETRMVSDAMNTWLNELAPGSVTYSAPVILDNCQGFALNEAPRGALGHWVSVTNKTISNYQMVVPSTWNLSPRCGADKPGPLEAALVGTPVSDLNRPIELLRVVHSYDPCIACAVHVFDNRGNLTIRLV